MIAIITEKPSVGQDIARVVGANIRKEGYSAGNGYMVTWALGHLVSLAMPGAYGYDRTSTESLPMIPDPFRLVVRQIRTDRGMVTDIVAAKQLKIIDDVFSKCDNIIVATDAGREGELIFRYIYEYLATPSLSAGCGYRRSQTRQSVSAWRTCATVVSTTAFMPPQTVARKPTGLWE